MFVNDLFEKKKPEPEKPRNFVAKNAKMGGAGAHKDKKKADKQGVVKHKKDLAADLAESNRDYELGFASPSAPALGNKAGFKRQELQHELGHEQNNIAIAINGKTWKVVPGRGRADSKEEWSYLNNMKSWADKKSASSGKKWTVHLTGAPATNEAKLATQDKENRFKAIKQRDQRQDRITHQAMNNVSDEVAEGSELKQAKRKYNQAAKDANTDQVGAGKKIDTMKKSLRQKDINKQVAEGNLGHVLPWPAFVNKISSAMKAMGWKGQQRKDTGAFMFSTRGQLDDEFYIAIIDNEGNGMFTYALGTVEEGDPHIGEKDTLPITEASVSELMTAIREGFGLSDTVSENQNPYGYEVGQTVKLHNGAQGRVLDIFDDSIEVLLPGGRTVTVAFQDANVLDEGGKLHGGEFRPVPDYKPMLDKMMGSYGQSPGANKTPAVDAKGRTQGQWLKLIKAKFPGAKVMQAKMPDGPCYAVLPDGRKLSWSKAKVEQSVNEVGEWKDESKDYREWSNHVKDELLSADPSQRYSLAKRLSQIETKHFGTAVQTGYNSQTGRPDSTSGPGLTTTVKNIYDAIESGKLKQAGTASTATTQQTPFGSVTRPVDQPDPYHASPASQYGDRPDALAALKPGSSSYTSGGNSGGGSIKILKTEEDWEEALSTNNDQKAPNWKEMLAFFAVTLATPIIGGKIKNLLMSKMKEDFGVEMSYKEVLGWMKHIATTPSEQHLSPAVWKFEKDGGDYETAIEQLPDDAVNTRPAEVMSAIATDLISTGTAEEIKSDEEPAAGGASAFGNMASQLTKKKEPVDETKSLHKRVKIVRGPDAGKYGYIRQIEHGLYKGAPKRYDIDLEGGGQANNLSVNDLRIAKDQGVAEATGDEKFDKSMRQMTGKITPADAAEMWPTKEFEPYNLDPSRVPNEERLKAKLFPLAYQYWTDGDNADELRALGWEPEYGDDYVMVVLYGIGHDGHIQYDKYDFDAEGEDEDESMAEGSDPASAKFGKYIKKYFDQIYNYGDDGLNYLDNNAPFWAELFSKHNGDIDDIIAMEPANVLKQAALELKAVASDLPYELDEQGMAEGVAESIPLDDALKVLRQYGAEHFKTTSNALNFYKNGRLISVDLIWNDDATRDVTLSSLNSATRKLKGQGVSEVAPPGAKAERMVKHIKKGYAKDGKITPKEKSIAYATAWKAHNKEINEEIEIRIIEMRMNGYEL